jgi:starvation-inducible DNA-binding protein
MPAILERPFTIDIGIEEPLRRAISAELGRLLADTYTLYLQTHNFHWNVTGPSFQTLHLLFEQQYNELALAVDLIAERIRALGMPAPGTYREFAKLTSIREPAVAPTAEEMLRDLVSGNEIVIRTARAIVRITEEGHDYATADLLTQRLAVHEKAAWMLRSLLPI